MYFIVRKVKNINAFPKSQITDVTIILLKISVIGYEYFEIPKLS